MMDDRSMFAPLSDEETATTAQTAPARDASDLRPIVPVPGDAPAMAYRMRDRGAPSRSWPYHDAEGRLVGYVCRWDFIGDDGKATKEVRPVTFCENERGKRAWRQKGMPSPRPLFDLPGILASPDALVLVCEGEKARDAGAVLFPEMVATTPAHGAKSPHLTDWSPLAGRTVVIATDHDEPGRKDGKGKPLHPGRDFGDLVCRLAREAGAADVMQLRPDRIGSALWVDGVRTARGGSLPDGWDIADAVEEGWTAARVDELHADGPLFVPYLDARARAEVIAEASGLTIADDEDRKTWPFRRTSAGVEKRIERTVEGITTFEWKWFCSPLDVVADTRSSKGEEWGRLLEVRDRDGRSKQWAMPMGLMAGDGTAYRERFLSLGLVISPGQFGRNSLHEYISTAKPDAKARCVSRTGWQDRTFISFAGNHGDEAEGERHIIQTSGPVDHAYRSRGSLAEWQEEIARYAVGNSRLALAISTAFAAPLLYPTGAESGGFHFRGGSSTGKTTALTAGGSVWGGGGTTGYLRKWRATSNGLEGTASQHCDTLLCLDEIGQVSGTEAGATAYMLGNGSGKIRAGRAGEVRPVAEWRLLFLSSGEISLADKMAEDGRGRRVAAGQEVRIVDLPADAGCGLGAFENVHGFPSADAFARHLNVAASRFYGTAAPEFLRQIASNFDAIAPAVTAARDEFLSKHCPEGADGQVSRVASRFALVAAGGEMASALGVLPWPAGEAERAAAKCLSDWLSARGGLEPAEERQALSTVRRFIEAHGNSRFEAMGSLVPRTNNGDLIEQRTINRVGFRRPAEGGGIEYLVLPEAWKSEICAGMDAGSVAKALASRALLVIGSDGKPQVKTRLPSAEGTTRCYIVRPAIMGHGGEADA